MTSFMKRSASFSPSMYASTPWWTGVPTKLIRKNTIVEPNCSINSPEYRTASRLAVHTLTFEIPQGHSSGGMACSHNNIRLDYGDVVKMVIPGYKPKSYSLSAVRPEKNEMDITIKVYPNGRASGYLDRLRVGDTVNSFGMRSRRSRNAGKFFGGVAYGVGITEILPVAEAELKKGDAEKVVVLWASRTSNDTFWLDKIAKLEIQYPEKFEMVHIYSREEHPDPRVLKGRIDPQVLANVFMPRIENAHISKKDARFLAVGTKEMIGLTGRMLGNIGYPMPRYELLPNK